MLNGNWYRMTEKQDLESPSEPGIEFEAFNISEAKRISTRRQKVKGTVRFDNVKRTHPDRVKGTHPLVNGL